MLSIVDADTAEESDAADDETAGDCTAKTRFDAPHPRLSASTRS
jgi:hypothetical protein